MTLINNSRTFGTSFQSFFLICLLLSPVSWIVESRRFGVRNKLLQNGRTPFVLLYEHESFRGKEILKVVGKSCTLLEPPYANWTSSVDSHRSCVTLCQDLRCEGPCQKVFSNQGISRLSKTGFNDNIQSLRTCYF